jgi:hypothetical protein
MKKHAVLVSAFAVFMILGLMAPEVRPEVDVPILLNPPGFSCANSTNDGVSTLLGQQCDISLTRPFGGSGWLTMAVSAACQPQRIISAASGVEGHNCQAYFYIHSNGGYDIYEATDAVDSHSNGDSAFGVVAGWEKTNCWGNSTGPIVTPGTNC